MSSTSRLGPPTERGRASSTVRVIPPRMTVKAQGRRGWSPSGTRPRTRVRVQPRRRARGPVLVTVSAGGWATQCWRSGSARALSMRISAQRSSPAWLRQPGRGAASTGRLRSPYAALGILTGPNTLCAMQTNEVSDRELVSSGAPWEPVVGYSRAVRVGKWVSVAGTTAAEPDGGAVGGQDVAEQTREAIRRIAEALEQVGSNLQHVVRTRMFVTDINRWKEVGRAHGEFFADIRPASSIVQVSALIDPALGGGRGRRRHPVGRTPSTTTRGTEPADDQCPQWCRMTNRVGTRRSIRHRFLNAATLRAQS